MERVIVARSGFQHAHAAPGFRQPPCQDARRSAAPYDDMIEYVAAQRPKLARITSAISVSGWSSQVRGRIIRL